MHRRITLVSLFAVLITLIIIGTGFARSHSHQHNIVVCFSTKSWDGDEDARPCNVVGLPAEDGSTRIFMGTASGMEAVCLLPNPREERGAYYAACQRR